MKSFREHLSEEVLPTALVADGNVDVRNEAVRNQINATLSQVTGRLCVTPYGILNKIRKALAYFHIDLPRRSYMEGRHGVEVYEVHQFGPKMGMTNQGEFVKEVPCEYYLFVHYHLMGSMYMVRARLVDKKELDKEMDTAEAMIAEDAATMQAHSKMIAPKEKQHTALGDCDCSQGDSPSTKQAVEVSMRRKDKKLSADKLDEAKKLKGRPDPKLSYFDPPKPEKVKKEPARTKGSPDPKLSYFDNPATKAERKKYIKSLPFEEETLDELSKETLSSYREKVAAKHLPGTDAKSFVHTRGHTTAGRKLGMSALDATLDTITKRFTPKAMKNLADKETKARESDPGFQAFKARKRD